MKTYVFVGAMNVRAYGTFTLEAESLQAALDHLRDEKTAISQYFSPHGGGSDDFDFEIHRPELWIESLEDETAEGGELYIEQQILTPAEVVESAAPDMLAALKAALPHISQEVEQRKHSGDDEYWADLEKVESQVIAAIAKAEGRDGGA